MKKIKKTFLYLAGVFLTFIANHVNAANEPEMVALYGIGYQPKPIDYLPEPTFWEKISAIILEPIIIILTISVALIIGIIIFIKRKRKNVKRNP